MKWTNTRSAKLGPSPDRGNARSRYPIISELTLSVPIPAIEDFHILLLRRFLRTFDGAASTKVTDQAFFQGPRDISRMSSPMERNTSTIRGSKCDPAPWRMIASAFSWVTGSL